ncbi:MAG: DUF2442 domain-containing protein [Verrucomicrobiota bacterium]|nr:DUF2442 domain-containing protein [Verrucomicrobiota bacterium]
MPWRVTHVKPLADYRLDVTFVDGTQGEVDISKLILSSEAGVFEVLRDINLFNQVYIEHGAVTWPGEIDLAPDAMYKEIKKHGKWVIEK